MNSNTGYSYSYGPFNIHIGGQNDDFDSDDEIRGNYRETHHYHYGGNRTTVITTTTQPSYSNSSTSLLPPESWRKIIQIARKATTFNCYPWRDNPNILDGKTSLERVTWLAKNEGFPFSKYFSFNPSWNSVSNLNKQTAIQFLFLTHKIRYGLYFDEENFCNAIGDVGVLMNKVGKEDCVIL